MTCVLIVEDDPEMSTALTVNLRARRYEVHAASDAQTALRLATTLLPDLAIVDLGLPDMDGIDVIRALRGWTSVPIIVLSARDSQSDKVDSLDAGADDYLTKPFGMDELLARMRAGLRRASPSNDDPVVITPTLRIDLGAKRILREGVEVRLTPTEWYFLEALVRRPGKLVPAKQLLHEIWGPKYAEETNYLRVYVAQLRRKVEIDPSHPRHLITEPGLGYRFEP